MTIIGTTTGNPGAHGNNSSDQQHGAEVHERAHVALESGEEVGGDERLAGALAVGRDREAREERRLQEVRDDTPDERDEEERERDRDPSRRESHPRERRAAE